MRKHIKNYLLFILIIFIGCTAENDQIKNCSQNNGLSIDQDVSITSLEEVNRYIENPYKEINGTLYISNIDDLSFLSCLEKVKKLHIYNSDNENLVGLTNLIEVDELHITNMTSLKNLEGLNSLNKIKYLEIRNNPKLQNFEGLESLEILGEMKIENNQNLINFKGFENVLTNIYYGKNRRWEISENQRLTSISALNNIQGELKSFINIYQCSNLKNFGVFKSIKKLTGMTINNCASITHIDWFPNLKEVGGIGVYSSGEVEKISFPALEKAASLSIERNKSLRDLNFSSLTEISGGGEWSITIDENDNLITLAGLENLEFTEGIVWINQFFYQANPLQSVCALRKLNLNQINNGIHDNKIYFKTKCSANGGNPYSDISEFDRICDCS